MRTRDARIAGLFYALAIVLGWFCLRYIPDRIVVTGDAAGTVKNMIGHEWLFRLGIAGDLVCGTVWLVVVLLLYRLLRDVDRTQAYLMVILGALLQVPLYFVNAVNYAGALLFATGAPFLSPFSVAQRDALAMVFLRLHHYQLLSSFLFAGLWLIPFGILVYKSRFLPRLLGVWLILGGVAYIAISLTEFIVPQYSALLSTITSPLLLGELAITLWLLFAPITPTYSASRSDQR